MANINGQMNEDEFLNMLADKLLARGFGQGAAGACDMTTSANAHCANVLYSQITTERFYRSCRTNIDQIETGAIPIVPGQSTTLAQIGHPGWYAGCFQLTYRLANNGINHGDIKLEWFIDGELLDTTMYGSEIYDNNNNLIGDGFHPVPMACGKQCCIGALNKLKLKITHTGVANQLEQPRVFVNHGVQACCNSCGITPGKCQTGCNGQLHQPQQPQLPAPIGMHVPKFNIQLVNG